MSRFGRLSALAAENVARDRLGAAMGALGVALGTGALCFFVGLGLGVSAWVRGKVFPVDLALVEVVPPQLSLGALLGGGQLDDAAVARLKALPGVEAAWPKQRLEVPAVSRYDGAFFGSTLRIAFEVLAVGADPGLVASDVEPAKFQDPGSDDKPIPVIASTRLLELYNRTFAPARRLPRLSSDLVRGFTFPATLGASWMAPVEGMARKNVTFEVVGFSDRGLIAGVTVPLATVERWHRDYGKTPAGHGSVVLRARDPGEVPVVVSEVKRMGFEVDDADRHLAEQAGGAIALVTAVLALLSALICALSALHIGQSWFAAVRARSRELALFRAVGATASDLRNLVLLEAGRVGLLGGVLGSGSALLLALATDAAIARLLPEFPFKPASVFLFPPWLLGGGLLLGLLASLVGAWFPARRAAQTDPARTLAGA